MIAITLVLFFTWLPVGILIMEVKIKNWQTLVINNNQVFCTNARSIEKKRLLVLIILWPSQMIDVLQYLRKAKTLRAIPLTPIRLDINATYRSMINISIMDSETIRQKKTNWWTVNIIALGWLNVVFYAVDLIIAAFKISFLLGGQVAKYE